MTVNGCATRGRFREALECAWQRHRFGRAVDSRFESQLLIRATISASIDDCVEWHSPSLPKRWLCHAHSKALRAKSTFHHCSTCHTHCAGRFPASAEAAERRKSPLFRSPTTLPTHAPIFSSAESAI